jgi:hypothetical protein
VRIRVPEKHSLLEAQPVSPPEPPATFSNPVRFALAPVLKRVADEMGLTVYPGRWTEMFAIKDPLDWVWIDGPDDEVALFKLKYL